MKHFHVENGKIASAKQLPLGNFCQWICFFFISKQTFFPESYSKTECFFTKISLFSSFLSILQFSRFFLHAWLFIELRSQSFVIFISPLSINLYFFFFLNFHSWCCNLISRGTIIEKISFEPPGQHPILLISVFRIFSWIFSRAFKKFNLLELVATLFFYYYIFSNHCWEIMKFFDKADYKFQQLWGINLIFWINPLGRSSA